MLLGRYVVFFLVIVTTLSLLNVYVFRWARNAFFLGRRGQLAVKTALWGAILGMVLGRVAGRLWPGRVSTAVIAVSSTLELALIFSGLLLLVVHALTRVWALAASSGQQAPSAPASAPDLAPPPAASSPMATGVPVVLPRRAFITQAAVSSAFLIGGSTSLYGALKGRNDYVIESVPIKLPGLSRGLDGFTIVQLSDVHIGAYVGQAELNIAEELIRQAKPDLLVLTGDLLDSDARLAEQLGRFIRRVGPLAREGVVAISGNHDYFAGVDQMAHAVVAGGGRILRNDARVIGAPGAAFALLGVDDVWARRSGGGPDVERALLRLPRLGGRVAPALDLPRVLLCHNPSYFEEASGQVGLQLSGHTHGGQINLGVRPADYLLPGGWVAGRYEQRGSILYVNRGFGTVGPPARLGSPPEVTRIVLTA